MDIAKDFKSFHDQAISALVKTTKTAGQISAEDLTFHRSSNVAVASALDAQSDRLLRLTNKLTKYATSHSDVKAPQLRDQDDVEDNWRGVVDVIDDLLERTDACLDEFTGVIKRLSPSRQGSVSETMPSRSSKAPSIFGGASLNMAKPQLLFEKAPDNLQTAPFRPLLTSKPYAVVPLEQSLGDGEKGYHHPYAEEITRSTYPRSAYEKRPPHPFQTLDTPATFVDTPEALLSMLAELKTAKEIAIDLEHHDVRSYIGIVSLMQISTRDQDWIVDTLKSWRHKLQVLNEVFADPSILKVFHGSYMDMVWLQRDFGLYVVNLFDTYHASEALELEKHSLKFLLQMYCNVNASKKYQTADWRVRPIPPAMIDYARSDTHYLLFIYDCMRNELIDASTPEASLIDYVCEESKKYALQKYERTTYDAKNGQGSGGWSNLLSKMNFRLTKDQLFVLKAVHQWRDKVARLQDDGIHHVMSNALLFSIAQEMPLDQVSLHKACRPITPTVRSRVTELLGVIRKAKIEALNAPDPIKTFTPTQIAPLPTSRRESESAISKPKGPEDSSERPSTLRSETSRLWGKALPTRTISPADDLTSEGFSICLPMPQIIGTFSEDQTITRQIPARQISIPTQASDDATPTTSTDTDTRPEVFTLQQLGGRRKRKAETLEDGNGAGSTIPLDADDDPMDMNHGASNKASRRALKKAKKAERQAQAQANGSGPSALDSNPNTFTPYDYDNADSVLHAKPEGSERTKGRDMDKKGKEKVFDPYRQALDAAEPGLKRLRTEMPGMGRVVTYRK